MRTKNSIANISVETIYYFFNILIGFFMTKYLIQSLGVEYAGLNSFFQQVIGYLNLADLGFSAAATYKLYKPIRNNDKKRIKELFSALHKIYFYLGFFILISGSLFSLFINYFINNNTEINPFDVRLYFLLYLISVAIKNFYIEKITIMQAHQKLYKINKYIHIIDVIKRVAQLYFIISFNSYRLGLISLVLGNFLIYIVVILYFNKQYSITLIENYGKTLKEIMKDAKYIFVHKFSTVIVDGTDYITLSFFLGLAEVNLYANYNMVLRALKGISSKFFNAIMPSVGDLLVDANQKKINRIFVQMLLLSNFITIFFLLGFFNFIEDFIIIWLGQDFILERNTVILFLINFYINTVMAVFVIFKSSKGLYKDDVNYVYLQAITNLIMSIILVQRYGINGVLIGTLIGNVLGLIYPKIKIVYSKILEESPIELLKTYIKILFIFLIIFIFNKFIYIYIDKLIEIKSSFWSFTLGVMIYSMISLFVQFILFFSINEFREIIVKLFNNYIKKRSKNV